jgi:predicted amidophosphoribosyltransferase
MIQESGLEDFSTAMNQYLTEEKYPQLFIALADDLQPVCIHLRESLIKLWRDLDSQPREVDTIKQQKLKQVNIELKKVGDQFCQQIETELNQIVASHENTAFEQDFNRLKRRMVNRLDELIRTFSVGETYKRAQASHKRNAVVPVIGILAEAFYYLANELETVLVDASQDLINHFFHQLIGRVRTAHYYSQLYRLLGNDAEIELSLKQWCNDSIKALINEAKTECDRYIRERPEFYSEGTVSVFQLRQVLQEACRGYDYDSMVKAEPAIRQLLKIDFDPKISETILHTFRPTINKTLIHHLLEPSTILANHILKQHDKACEHLAKILDKEAKEQLSLNEVKKVKLQEKIATYNQAISEINQYLEAMNLERQILPTIEESDLQILPISVEDEAVDNHYNKETEMILTDNS